MNLRAALQQPRQEGDSGELTVRDAAAVVTIFTRILHSGAQSTSSNTSKDDSNTSKDDSNTSKDERRADVAS